MDVIEGLARRAVRERDGTALQALFSEARDPLYHFLFRRLGNAADAEDAAQETFREALKSLAGLREPRAFRGWLYRIALRVAGRIRKAQATRPVATLLQPESPRMNPDVREEIARAVEALDDDHRTTLRLRYEQDLSYEEIAEAMDCPSGTVAKRLHTAHGRLRELLAGAGLVLALSQVSQALESVPRIPAPPRVADALLRMVREAGPSGLPSRPPVPTKAILVATATALLIGVAWFAQWRKGPPVPRTAASAPRMAGSHPTPEAPISPTIVGRPSDSGNPAIPGARVRGTVRDRLSGRSISDARVKFGLIGAAFDNSIEATSDSFGAYSVLLPPGQYEVTAVAEGYLAHWVWQAFERVRVGNLRGQQAQDEFLAQQQLRITDQESLTRDIDLVQAGEIRGLVVDAAGAPLAGVQVRLRSQVDPVSMCQHSYWHGGIPTGPDGRFTMHGLFFEGTCRLQFTAEGFEPAEEHVVLEHGRAEVNVQMLPGLAIQVEVVDTAGRPVPGAALLVGGNDLESVSTTTDAAGRALLKDLDRGTRVVVAYAGGYGAAASNLGTDSVIRLVLPSASLRIQGRVLNDTGEPLAGVAVFLHHYGVALPGGPGQVIFLRNGTGWGCLSRRDGFRGGFMPSSESPPSTVTGQDGRFELEGVAGDGGGSCLGFILEGYERSHRAAGSADLGVVVLKREKK